MLGASESVVGPGGDAQRVPIRRHDVRRRYHCGGAAARGAPCVDLKRGNAIVSGRAQVLQQPQGAPDGPKGEQPLRAHQPPARLSTCHAWQRREQGRGQRRPSVVPNFVEECNLSS